jgi:hypothetical protein
MKDPMPYIKNALWFMLGFNTILLLVDASRGDFGLCLVNVLAMVSAGYALSQPGEDHVRRAEGCQSECSEGQAGLQKEEGTLVPPSV